MGIIAYYNSRLFVYIAQWNCLQNVCFHLMLKAHILYMNNHCIKIYMISKLKRKVSYIWMVELFIEGDDLIEVLHYLLINLFFTFRRMTSVSKNFYAQNKLGNMVVSICLSNSTNWQMILVSLYCNQMPNRHEVNTTIRWRIFARIFATDVRWKS